eukprot:TRINITY_DN3178_c0_g1_i4.p1 TRINITY_DN3178_c0_g1~~TRINITY_DN3178_c0_g1_i4.p1  ORF type:complete len:124 (-),score=16.09 TRINITY_DN3178_c0_g1_i4:79-450(-)
MGEQIVDKNGRSTVLSNDKVAELAQEYITFLLSFMKTHMELEKIDHVGYLSVLISETAKCRDRRWHDIDLINKMISATATTDTKDDRNILFLNYSEHTLLSKLVVKKFSLWVAMKEMINMNKE